MRTPLSPPDHGRGGARRLLSLATERRALGWQVTAVALVAYLGLALLVEMPPVLMSMVGVGFALALQWSALSVAHRSVLATAAMRRHPGLGALLIVLVVFMTGNVTLIVLNTLFGGAATIGETPAMWLARAGLLLLVTATWVVLDDYRRSTTDAKALQAALLQTRADGVARVRAQRTEVIERVTDMLGAGLAQASDALRAPDRLRQLAREQIRPLSHDLASVLPEFEPRRPVPPPQPSWRVVVGAALDRPIVRPVVLATLVTVLFFAQTGAQASSDSEESMPPIPADASGVGVAVDLGSLLLSLGYLAAIFVAAWVGGSISVRVLTPRLASAPTAVRIGWVLLIPLVLSVAIQTAVQILYAIKPPDDRPLDFLTRLLATWPIVLIAFLLLLLLRSVNDLLFAVQARQRALADDLAWEAARARETLIQERRFFATAIHGPLQSAVAAAAMALEDRIRRGMTIDDAWEPARSALLSAVRALEAGPPQHRDLTAESAALISTWQGVCDIEIEVTPSADATLAVDWVTAGTVADLVTEAVANAVVHGGASRIRVEVSQEDPTTVRVVVLDDGTGLAGPADPGLGSQQLDEVSTHWRREFGDGWTRLEVMLPAQGSAGVVTAR